LMADENVDMSDAAIFADTSATIRRALEKSHALRSQPTQLTSTAMGIALNAVNPVVTPA